MKKIILIISVLLLGLSEMNAAPAYGFRVKFKDKNGTLTFADSLQFLSQKSLARRNFQGIALDSTDLPVVKQYIDTVMVTASAVKLHNVSKWFNQVVIITMDSSKINDVLALPMVASAQCVAVWSNGNYQLTVPSIEDTKFKTTYENNTQKKTRGNPAFYSYTYQQIDLIQADCLHDMGYMGQGMDIALFDVNFRYANTCNYFDSLNMQNRVKDQWSFIKDTGFVFSTSVNSGHGKDALGCMAGYKPGEYVGSAPKANFFLYNTEDVNGERPVEEDNWLSAAERADSAGVWVVNSSLGYNTYDAPLASMSYTYSNHFDGKTTMIAQALNKLSSKGILVVQAQGNEGCGNWHYLLTPADADSAISVGSVDGSGIWACSGYGPNSNGKTKPDVVCMGKAVMLVQDNCDVPGAANGSSFASPTMCGAIACLWQAFPTKTAWQIKQLVRMSSNRYTNPNNTEGYGIPDFCIAYNLATGTGDIQQIDYQFAIYPNPTQDGSFYVKSFQPNAASFTYSICDLNGRVLFQSKDTYQQSFHSDALRSMAPGNYLLQIQCDGKVYTTKLVR